MKSWRYSAGWHIVHGRLTQECARLMSSDRLFAQGKEEELVGRLQRGLQTSEENIVKLLQRNHTQWTH